MLNHRMFAELGRQGLFTEYYSGQTFSLCRVADWSLMAIAANPYVKTDSDGDEVSATFFAWHVDQAFAEKIIANNALFAATMLSKQSQRNPDLMICSEDAVQVLGALRDEVASGKRPSRIDSGFENMLKGWKLRALEPTVKLYGNPPVFSERKFWKVMLAFFLYPFGLPWFMAGDRKGGFLELGFFLLVLPGAAFPPLLIIGLALAVVHVFVFYFRLFCGKVKDEKGLQVMTEKQKKQVEATVRQYNEYKKELGLV